MSFPRIQLLSLALISTLALLISPCSADDLRKVKQGEVVPDFRLPSLQGDVVDSATFDGSVVVLVYLSAQQRRSELAATESYQVVDAVKSENVRLIHVTADIVQKSYFEQFRAEHSITTPLAFDTDRTLYGKLGMIVFPTTIIIDQQGKLAQVISLHGDDYMQILDAYIRHSLGQIDDTELSKRLAAPSPSEGSPKSLASAHRALARTMRERGRFEAAEDELQKAIELDPENIEVKLDMADLEFTLGNPEKAETLVNQVLAEQPDHRRAKQLKGMALYYRGRFDEAERILTESLSLNPRPEYAHYYLGLIFDRRGDKAKAAEHYREALRHFIDEPEYSGDESESE